MTQRAGGPRWWVAKSRRVGAYLGGRVSETEVRDLAGLATPAQLALFRSMHPADQRHSLDVVAALRRRGVSDPDLLLAGLLHDTGKGQTGLPPRIVHSLGMAYGSWIPGLARRLPGLAGGLDRLADHAERSARLAATAGCSPRTVELIRYHVSPRDDEQAQLLRLADEAS